MTGQRSYVPNNGFEEVRLVGIVVIGLFKVVVDCVLLHIIRLSVGLALYIVVILYPSSSEVSSCEIENPSNTSDLHSVSGYKMMGLISLILVHLGFFDRQFHRYLPSLFC